MGKKKQPWFSNKAIRDVIPDASTDSSRAAGSSERKGNVADEEAGKTNVSFDSIYYSPFSPSFSRSSHLGETTDIEVVEETEPDELKLPKSDRFFFSPFVSKSIMEESRINTRLVDESSIYDQLPVFFRESLMMSMSSDDPYHDFRASMEEMVNAHGSQDRQHLLELLHCYLRLNDKSNHTIIMLAFVDIIMEFMSDHRLLYSSSVSDSN